MNSFGVFVGLVFLACARGISVDGPGNHWIRNGGSQTLICRSELPISTCSWETPYGNLYTFGAAKIADGGRIKYISSESSDDHQCGITVEPLTIKDEGLWICHVGTVDSNGELETGVGSGKLTIAAEPLEVVIEKSDMKNNASMGNNTDFLKINCVVKGAKPEPSFTWFLEEELMENPEVETEKFEDDWIQTLILSPKDFDGNVSLKCSVTHFGLAEPLEVDTIIGMDLNVESSKTIVLGEAPIPLKYIAFVPLILLFFVPIHLYAYRRENREFYNAHCAKYFTRRSTTADEDLERGENGEEAKDEEKGDEKKDEEKPEEVKEEEEVNNDEKKESAWKKLKAWMAPKQLKEKKIAEEKNPEEEVGVDTVDDEKKEESTEEKKVEEDTKDEKVEEEVKEEKDQSPSS